MVYLWAFFIVSIISSFSAGSLDTGGNVLCLDTWKDKSGPYLHSIHFSFAIGAFLAPVIAIPFLGNNDEQTDLNNNSTYCYLNATQPTNITSNITIDQSDDSEPQTIDTKIPILYPLIGLSIVLMSLGYLLLAVRNYKHQKTKEEASEASKAG